MTNAQKEDTFEKNRIKELELELETLKKKYDVFYNHMRYIFKKMHLDVEKNFKLEVEQEK